MKYQLWLPLALFFILNEVLACRKGCDGGVKYTKANQTLHQQINKAPIDSLILRAPQFTKKYEIVLLVISAEWEKQERNEIRRLWAAGSESEMQRTGKSLVIFLVGRSSEVEKEAFAHKDILQVDIKETYRNLVYKIEVGFRWLNENVQSEFVAKIDSDTVVHIDRLYATLKRFEIATTNDWLICNLWKGVRINDQYSHWYVSEADYSHKEYPPYCNGPGYAMKRATLEKMVQRLGKYKVIEVEDVFFTGIIAQDLKVSHIENYIVATRYRTFSYENAYGPLMSILCTHEQFDEDKYKKDLKTAWKVLKNPKIH